MKVVSFNVNSIRMRLHQLQAVIDKHQPDIIGLQETKVTDEQFPVDAIEAMGYRAEFFGQKTHYGVALLTRLPVDWVQKGFAGDSEESQRRMIAIKTPSTNSGNDLVIVNGYFPQGENRSHPTKFPNKAGFYQNMNHFVEQQLALGADVVVMGDMNISPTDSDIGIGEENRKRWLKSGKCSFLPEEREWLAQLQNKGLVDTFRLVEADTSDAFSWFDYRSKGFEDDPKRGLRIDLILASTSLSEKVADAGIDYEIRGMDKPSDHAPIWTTFDGV